MSIDERLGIIMVYAADEPWRWSQVCDLWQRMFAWATSSVN